MSALKTDAVNVNDLPTATRLLKLVDDAPWGHIPPLQRGLLQRPQVTEKTAGLTPPASTGAAWRPRSVLWTSNDRIESTEAIS